MAHQPVACVSGAGRGIGRAVALALSQAGYRVVLTARNRAELDESAAACPGVSMVITGDITDPAFVESLFSDIEKQWGPVSVLVANAGAGVSASVVRTTDEDWQRMLDLNLTAPFRCIRRVLPSMIEAGFGRVIVVASVAAKIGEPYISAYTASKHGVLGLVRSAAAEVATKGVTVNAVCPGYVDTPMTDATIAGIVAKTGRSEAEARSALEAKQPIGRLITPEEVASAVMQCVTNGAINGQGLNIDGGAVV
ncbi:MAG: SDR family oxidoreductase [Marmoricola sp.]